MSQRNARRLLWLAALIALPVPWFLGAVELSPVVRLGFFTSLLSAVLVAEGGRKLAMLVGLGVAETLLYAALLWLGASLLARAIARLAPPAARNAVVALIVLGLFAASLSQIYQTSLSSTQPRSSVLQLFQ